MGRRRPAGLILWLFVFMISLPAAPGRASQGIQGMNTGRGGRPWPTSCGRSFPGGSGVLMLDSAPEPENATFRQESHLYYLTGTEIPESALVLIFDRPAAPPGRKTGAGTAHYAEYLYLPERDYDQERWRGARPGAGGLRRETLQPDEERREAMALTGFDRVPGRTTHLAAIPGARGAAIRSCRAPGALPRRSGCPLPPRRARQTGRTPLPRPGLPEAGPGSVPDARLQGSGSGAGSDEEREVPGGGGSPEAGHRDHLHGPEGRPPEGPGRDEGVPGPGRRGAPVHLRGARRPGFPSIVGAGASSCVLHYDANDGLLEEGDLLLIDAGAEYRRYSADVTGPFPSAAGSRRSRGRSTTPS